MLGKITTTSTVSKKPVDSQVETQISTSYLINTDYITELVDQTTTRDILYKFNVYDDGQTEFFLNVTNTVAAITTLADATASSQMLSLNVFEGIQSFNQVTGLTAVDTAFNVKDIVWGEESPLGDYTRIWYTIGGKELVPVIVNHTIDQIVDLADDGATTTTTSSTSTSSTSTTSTTEEATTTTTSTSTIA